VANLVAFLLVLLLIPMVWWIYGARGLAAAAWSGIRFLIPVALGALGGLVAALVSTAVGASTRASLVFGLGAGAAACLRMVLKRRVDKAVPPGIPLATAAPPTEVDHIWVPPQPRFFKCAFCGYTTEEADRPWGILQTTGACPVCRAPVRPLSGEPTGPPLAEPSYQEALQFLRQQRDSGALSEREYLQRVLDLAEKDPDR
jgi:hypothetical protein